MGQCKAQEMVGVMVTMEATEMVTKVKGRPDHQGDRREAMVVMEETTMEGRGTTTPKEEEYNGLISYNG